MWRTHTHTYLTMLIHYEFRMQIKLQCYNQKSKNRLTHDADCWIWRRRCCCCCFMCPESICCDVVWLSCFFDSLHLCMCVCMFISSHTSGVLCNHAQTQPLCSDKVSSTFLKTKLFAKLLELVCFPKNASCQHINCFLDNSARWITIQIEQNFMHFWFCTHNTLPNFILLPYL